MNPRFLTSRASAGRETQPQSATEPHRRQLPGTCRRKEVNATQIDEHLSSQRLQDFVRCAGMELETAGYFGMVSLSTDPRWRSCSIYLFGVDMYGNTLFSRNPYNLGMGMRALWS